MPDLGLMSRPMRRILAEWIGKLADRLLRFQSQLRYGFIRMLSTTVAETIEDQFHRSHSNGVYRDSYDEEYLDDHQYDEAPYSATRSAAQIEASPQFELPEQPFASTHPEGWFSILSHAAHILMQWIRGPWAEPILASAVTMISLVLLVR